MLNPLLDIKNNKGVEFIAITSQKLGNFEDYVKTPASANNNSQSYRLREAKYAKFQL
jgi:hypothetical protein